MGNCETFSDKSWIWVILGTILSTIFVLLLLWYCIRSISRKRKFQKQVVFEKPTTMMPPLLPIKREKTETLHDESPFKNPALQRRRPTGFERPRLDQDSFISETSALEKMPEGLPTKSSKDRIKWSDSVQEIGEPMATSTPYSNLPKTLSTLSQSGSGETLQRESQKTEEPLRVKSSMESTTERVKRSESIPRHDSPEEGRPEPKSFLRTSGHDSKVRSEELPRERFGLVEDSANKTQQRDSALKDKTQMATPEYGETQVETPEFDVFTEARSNKSPYLEKPEEASIPRRSSKSDKPPQESSRREYLVHSPSPKSQRFSLVKVDLSDKVDASRFSIQQNDVPEVRKPADVPDVARRESYESAKSRAGRSKGTETFQSEKPASLEESQNMRKKLLSGSRESCAKDHSGGIPDVMHPESYGAPKSEARSRKATDRFQSEEPARYDENESMRRKLLSRTRESCARDHSGGIPDVVHPESYGAARSEARSRKATDRFQSEEPARHDESESMRRKLLSRTRESCAMDNSADIPDVIHSESYRRAKSQSRSRKTDEIFRSGESGRCDESENTRKKLLSKHRESCAKDNYGNIPDAIHPESYGAAKSQARSRKDAEPFRCEEPVRYDECEQIRRKLLTPRPRDCYTREQHKTRMSAGGYYECKTGRMATTPKKAQTDPRGRSGPGKCQPTRLFCGQMSSNESTITDEGEETEQSTSSESSGVTNESSSLEVSDECRETERTKTETRNEDKMPCEVTEEHRGPCKRQSIINDLICNTAPRHSYKLMESLPKVEKSEDEINIITCPQMPYMCQYQANRCCYCYPSCTPYYHMSCIPVQPCSACGECQEVAQKDPIQVHNNTRNHTNPAIAWNGDGDSNLSSGSDDVFQAPNCNKNPKGEAICHNFNWHNAQKNVTKNSVKLDNLVERFGKLEHDMNSPVNVESRIAGRSRRERVSFELLNSKGSRTLQTEDASTNEPKVCYINLTGDKIDVASKLRELEEICSFNSLTNICANNNNLDCSEQLNNDVLDSKLNASENNNSNVQLETHQETACEGQSAINSNSECNIDLGEILDRHNCLMLPAKEENNVLCKMEYFPDNLDSRREIVYADVNIQTDNISGNTSDISFRTKHANNQETQEMPNQQNSPQKSKLEEPPAQSQGPGRMRDSLVKRTLKKFRMDYIFNRAYGSCSTQSDQTPTVDGQNSSGHRLIKIPNDIKRGVFSMLQPEQTIHELTLSNLSKTVEDPESCISSPK